MLIRYSTVFLLVLASIAVAQRDSFDEEDEHEDSQDVVLQQQEARNIRPRAYQSYHPNQNQVGGAGSGFRQQQQTNEDAAHAQSQQLRRPVFGQELEGFQNIPQVRPQAHAKRPHSQLSQELKTRLEEEEDELEKEEPDRLSQLLPESKFDCAGLKTGYYADEGLGCEVFHYCQDNTKHSWICPDGFTFHQVHLICMPPSNDNICQKSSQYHFVNDYLYKPLNAEEAQTRPNVTLRYSERFYPSEVYHDGRYDEDEEERPERAQLVAHRRPLINPSPVPSIANRRPQVFRSPEEVDIPLIQRRPQHVPQPFHAPNNHEFDYERK